jgi:hypothetical protein
MFDLFSSVFRSRLTQEKSEASDFRIFVEFVPARKIFTCPEGESRHDAAACRGQDQARWHLDSCPLVSQTAPKPCMRGYSSLKDASLVGIQAKIIFANAYDLIRLKQTWPSGPGKEEESQDDSQPDAGGFRVGNRHGRGPDRRPDRTAGARYAGPVPAAGLRQEHAEVQDARDLAL